MTENGPLAHKVAEDAYLRFLADEGLELLALYRDITDEAVRHSILDMVRVLARIETDNASSTTPIR